MSIFDKPKQLFKAVMPGAMGTKSLTEYVGRTVIVPEFIEVDGKKTLLESHNVVIKTICGSLVPHTPHYYEINGEHLISALRFHAQMEKADDITEDQFLAFEEMKVEAEKIDKGKKEKDVTSEIVQ